MLFINTRPRSLRAGLAADRANGARRRFCAGRSLHVNIMAQNKLKGKLEELDHLYEYANRYHAAGRSSEEVPSDR